MKKLKVELGELIFAFESDFLETKHYLDLETGKVVMVRDGAFRELEEIYQEGAYDPEAEEDSNLAEVLQQSNQPEGNRSKNG